MTTTLKTVMREGTILRMLCPFDDKNVEVSVYRFKNNLVIIPDGVMDGQVLNLRRGKIVERAEKFSTFKKALRDLLTKTKPVKTEIIAIEL